MHASQIKKVTLVLVLMGFMAPTQAFAMSAWFSSLSSRSKGALCVAAAVAVAGIGFFAYKAWSKPKPQDRPQAVVPAAPVQQPAEPAPIVQPVPVVQPAVVPAQEIEDKQEEEKKEKQEKEIKQKADADEWTDEWTVRNTFKIPEDIFSVAIGKNSKGATIILAGGMSCIYRIDTSTRTCTKLALPGPRIPFYEHTDLFGNGSIKEVPERIDTIKFVPHDRFIAQSKSHIRLCDIDGTILQQVEDISHFDPEKEQTYFDGIDVEIDKAGKFLVVAQKNWCGARKERGLEALSLQPFADGSLIESDSFNPTVIIKDKNRDLGLLYPDNHSYMSRYDACTGEWWSTERFNNRGSMIVIDDAHAISRDHDTLKMVLYGHCLHEMPTGARLSSKKIIISCVADSQGQCITADRGGAIKIWDHKNRTCKKIDQLDVQVSEGFGILHMTDHKAFQSLALNKRVFGDSCFVCAAKDGTIKVWAREEELKQQDEDASKAEDFFEKFGGQFIPLQVMISGYVGSDAHQAWDEIEAKKKKKEEL